MLTAAAKKPVRTAEDLTQPWSQVGVCSTWQIPGQKLPCLSLKQNECLLGQGLPVDVIQLNRAFHRAYREGKGFEKVPSQQQCPCATFSEVMTSHGNDIIILRMSHQGTLVSGQNFTVWCQFYHTVLPPNRSISVQCSQCDDVTSSWHHHIRDVTWGSTSLPPC